MNVIHPELECAVGKVAFEDALQRLLSIVPAPFECALTRTVTCPGHVLAEAVVACRDLPSFDQSAMDGYAIFAADAATQKFLPVIGRTAAGEAPGRLVTPGAYRVFTGAPIPLGADCVVVQEDVHVVGKNLILNATPPRGANIRRRGEDVRIEDLLISAGTVLDWRHQTMLAAQGIQLVAVRRPARVAVLSTGNGFSASPDLAPGQIHDSNLSMLAGLLAAWGADVRTTLTTRDDRTAMRAAFQRIAAEVDLVVSTGGVSVGEEDHVRAAVHEAGGRAALLKVAMKPGKPLAFGRVGDAVFLGLPGSPQAALAGAVGFLNPLLAKMSGKLPPAPCFARTRFAIRHKPGRSEFVPVRLRAPDGCLWAEVLGPRGSGRLRPMLEADGLAFLRADQGDIGPGKIVPVSRLPVASQVDAAVWCRGDAMIKSFRDHLEVLMP
jgi:molybdopterin molybdotransferase